MRMLALASRCVWQSSSSSRPPDRGRNVDRKRERPGGRRDGRRHGADGREGEPAAHGADGCAGGIQVPASGRRGLHADGDAEGFTPFTTRVSVNAKPSRVAIVLQVARGVGPKAVRRRAEISRPPVRGRSSSRRRRPRMAAHGRWRPRRRRLGRPSRIRSPARFNTEAYDRIEDNAFRLVTQDPLSTFSIDVDTASYSNVRRFLNDGRCRRPTRSASRS